MAEQQKLPKHIRQGVIAHIIRYDLLRKQEFRDAILSQLSPGKFQKLAGNRSRTLWDLIFAGAEAYLSGKLTVISYFYITTDASRTTVGRCIRILEQLEIMFVRTNDLDGRSKVVEFCKPARQIIDLYVNNCFEEFKDLITSHHDGKRHKAESELQDSEARYRSLVELAPDAILIITDDIIVFANNAAVQLFGAGQLRQLINRNIDDFIHPDFVKQAAKDRQIILRNHSWIRNQEQKALKLDGSAFDIETSSTYISWKGADSIQPIIRNISERKRIEQELKKSEERFSDFAITSSDWLWEMDNDNRYTYFSPLFTRYTGMPAKDIIGATQEELLSRLDPIISDSAKRNLLKIENITRNRQSWRDMEQEWICLNGEKRTLLASAHSIHDELGNYIGYRGAARDITERKKIEKELGESEKYQKLVELSPDGIGIHVNGKLKFCNSSLAKILGAEYPSDLIDLSIHDLIHSDFNDTVKKRINVILETGSSNGLYYLVYIRIDGTEIEVEVNGCRVSFDGEPAIQFYLRVINERRWKNVKLRKSEERTAAA